MVQTLPPASGASGLQTTTPGRPRGGPRSPGIGVLGSLSRWSRRDRAARLAGLSSSGAAGGLSHTPRPLGRPLADRLGAFRPLAPPGRAGGTQTYGQVEGSTGALGSGRDPGLGRLPEEGGWDLRRRGGPGLVGRGHAWGCASALPSPARPGPPPLSPRSLGRDAAPGPDVCSAQATSPPAPLPAAGRVRALRLLRAPDGLLQRERGRQSPGSPARREAGPRGSAGPRGVGSEMGL